MQAIMRNQATMTTTNAAVIAPQFENMPTMPELKELYLSFAKRRVKEITLRNYEVCLGAFLEWLSGCGIVYPTYDDVAEYVKFLASPHPKRTRSDRPNSKPGSVTKYTAETQARYFRSVKLMFRWAAQVGLYPDVSSGINGAKVKTDNTKKDPFEVDDAMKILNAIDRSTDTGKRDYAMLWLAFTSGLRIIEIQRANFGNLEMVAGEHALYVQGKGHDEADDYVKVSEMTYAAIMDYLGTRGKVDKDAPLFASTGNRSRGKRLSEPSVSRIFKERFREAGYDSARLTAHSTRHSCITFGLEDGMTIQQAQHLARHASPETTEQRYAHNMDKRKENFPQRVENYMLGVKNDTDARIAEVVKQLTEDQKQHALAILQAMAA